MKAYSTDLRERGEVASRKGLGRRPRWTAYAETLRNAVRTQPDIMLHELKQQYAILFSAPTLRPGDIAVMDNLAAHKVAEVRDLIEPVGANVAYLPPSSPHFNPIELLFSKLTSLLHRDAARTVQELWSLLGKLVPVFTQQECTRYCKHCRCRMRCSWHGTPYRAPSMKKFRTIKLDTPTRKLRRGHRKALQNSEFARPNGVVR